METKKVYEWEVKSTEHTAQGVRITFNDDKTLFIPDILLYEILLKYGESNFDFDKKYFSTNTAFSNLIIRNQFTVTKEVKQ